MNERLMVCSCCHFNSTTQLDVPFNIVNAIGLTSSIESYALQPCFIIVSKVASGSVLRSIRYVWWPRVDTRMNSWKNGFWRSLRSCILRIIVEPRLLCSLYHCDVSPDSQPSGHWRSTGPSGTALDDPMNLFDGALDGVSAEGRVKDEL